MLASSTSRKSLVRYIARCFSCLITAIDWFLVFVVGYVSRTGAGIVFWIFALQSGIQIHGFKKALLALRDGRLVIIANHPSLIEPVMLYGLFWPWSLIPRLAVWSMPDKKMLPFWMYWFFKPWRCFAFHRKNAHEAGKASHCAVTAIRREETVVIHPEGGRTRKGSEHVGSPDGRRRIRKIQGNTHRIIHDARARVLPIWIDHMPGKWPVISIHIGTIFGWYDFPDDDTEARRFLEQKILGAGE